MSFHDLLKQLVFAGVALTVSAYLWRTVANEYTTKVAESIKNQKPMEFKAVEFKAAMKFDSSSVIWTPPATNMADFRPKSTTSQPKSTFQSRPATSRSSSLHRSP